SSLRGAKRRSNPHFLLGDMDCFASLAMTAMEEIISRSLSSGVYMTLNLPIRVSKNPEVFALFPIRHFGLEALDLGVFNVDVIFDKSRAERIAEKPILFQRQHRFAKRLRQRRGLCLIRRVGGRTWTERPIDTVQSRET